MSNPVPEVGKNMGLALPRIDAHAKVTGTARFASDMPANNAAFAYLVTSTIARGRILSFDEAAARRVPGVRLILTHLNRPPLVAVKHFVAGGAGITAMPPLSGPEITHDGQIIAMVVADSFEAAREAAHRFTVRYQRQAPAATFGSPGVVEQRTSEVLPERKDPVLGNAEAALRASAVVHDAEYATPTQHHNPMELFATTASWAGDGV